MFVVPESVEACAVALADALDEAEPLTAVEVVVLVDTDVLLAVVVPVGRATQTG